MSTELKQFLRQFPVYHEFNPTFSALVNLDLLQVRQAFYQELSELVIKVFVIFQYEKTADLTSTFKMDLPVPALAGITNAGMFGTNAGPVAGANNPLAFDLAASQCNVSLPDSMSDFPQDGVSCISFEYVRS